MATAKTNTTTAGEPVVTEKPVIEAVSYDTFLVDNTDEVAAVAAPVAVEQYELLGGLTQVNYL